MNTPQIIWIVLAAMTLGITLVKHGKDRGKYSFWATCISLVIELWILWTGGFFGKGC